MQATASRPECVRCAAPFPEGLHRLARPPNVMHCPVGHPQCTQRAARLPFLLPYVALCTRRLLLLFLGVLLLLLIGHLEVVFPKQLGEHCARIWETQRPR
ncbi:hypothetical protein E2C01_042476 [Portunus trituberculatus]|uniref:Uncharacterized protein n=1 Tax=Portunus trituberculatus TaxID=210409 RepID=A0A5B7FTR8_PORTR|nr:hypothetical protein [Portunus trituberculatus]